MDRLTTPLATWRPSSQKMMAAGTFVKSFSATLSVSQTYKCIRNPLASYSYRSLLACFSFSVGERDLSLCSMAAFGVCSTMSMALDVCQEQILTSTRGFLTDEGSKWTSSVGIIIIASLRESMLEKRGLVEWTIVLTAMKSNGGEEITNVVLVRFLTKSCRPVALLGITNMPGNK